MAGPTVICVLRSGGVYGVDYVHRLERAVDRHLPSCERFVCLTDRAVPCESIPMRHAFPGKWSKVELFDPGLPLSGRILYLDLDVIVQGSLEYLAHAGSDFVIAASGPHKPHPNRVPGYNSSVMAWDHGARRQIFEKFDPSVMDRLIGDQDWIGEVCPHERTFRPGLIEKRSQRDPSPASPVVLCTNPKPHEIPHEPIVARHWLGEG